MIVIQRFSIRHSGGPASTEVPRCARSSAALIRLAAALIVSVTLPFFAAEGAPAMARQARPAILQNSPGPFMLQTQLDLGANAQPGDQFGQSVAVSDDGKTILVGAPGRTVDGAHFGGIAEVFRFASGQWSAPVELNLGSEAQEYNGFGFAVALSADGNTALIGVPGCQNRDVSGCTGAAAPVEVYRFKNGSWGAPTGLDLGSQSLVGTEFGYSVALSADGTTALIGAPDLGTTGAAELYSFSSGHWGAPTELSPPPGSQGDPYYGSSVALSGDGSATLVGVDGEGVTLSGDGKTALMSGGGGGPVMAWIASYPSGLGQATLVGGWYNGPESVFPVALSRDGTTAILGIPLGPSRPGDTVGGIQTDRLLYYGWGPEVGFTLNDAEPGDEFGASVAVDADGGLAVVGDPAMNGSGAVYILSPNPAAVVVMVTGSGFYGTTHSLLDVPANDPRITYNPASASGDVSGSLSCGVAAGPGSQAYPKLSYAPLQWYDFNSCRALSDPGHPLFYDYVDSKYYINRAPVDLTYTGPTTIHHGSRITLSAKLINKASGKPMSGRILSFQIQGRPSVGCDSTSPGGTKTDSQGVGGCVIGDVRTKVSSTNVSVSYAGTYNGLLPGHTKAPIKIAK